MKNCAEDVVSEFSRGFSKAFYAGYRTKRRFGSYPQVFNFEHHFPWEVAVGQSIPFRATALIVEDDPSQREMLSLLLEESDFDVIQCESAEAAELVLAKNGSALSLMVTDVNLAGPMNGVELAFIAKQHHPTLDVIVTSGRPLPGSLPDGAKFWSKPWAPLDLLREAELAQAVPRAGSG
jgi:two-component system cell cycle response regulator CpdR